MKDEILEGRIYAAKRFGLKLDEVICFHQGICYDRIVVKTQFAAIMVSQKVQGQFVNGGYFDGMPLGNYSKRTTGYEVYC